MTPEFVRCDFCKSEIPSETCKLAAYSTTIEGKPYVFCCEQCATRYKEKRKKKTK
jgi:YHS domain-containing protein